jgi:acyl-CoA thioesterase FadM
VKFEYQVTFSDIDFARVVFFGRFVYLANQAAEVWFHQQGVFIRDLYPTYDVALPVAAVFCRYLGPVRMEDNIVITTGLKGLRSKGFTHVFEVMHKDEERRVAWGYLERRFVDSERRPRECPDELRPVLKAMAEESREFVTSVWEPLAEKDRLVPKVAT